MNQVVLSETIKVVSTPGLHKHNKATDITDAESIRNKEPFYIKPLNAPDLRNPQHQTERQKVNMQCCRKEMQNNQERAIKIFIITT